MGPVLRLLPGEMYSGVVLVEGELQGLGVAADEFCRHGFGEIDRLIGRQSTEAEQVLSGRDGQGFGIDSSNSVEDNQFFLRSAMQRTC